MIQIFVEDYSFVSLSYDVSLDSPIRTLKTAIEKGEGIPVGKHFPITTMSVHNTVTSSTATSQISGPRTRGHQNLLVVQHFKGQYCAAWEETKESFRENVYWKDRYL
jgi:hypothetical protein